MAWLDCIFFSEPNHPWSPSSIHPRVRSRLSRLHLRERACRAEQIYEQREGHYCGQKNCYLGQTAIVAQIRAVKLRVLPRSVHHGLHLDPDPFNLGRLALHRAASSRRAKLLVTRWHRTAAGIGPEKRERPLSPTISPFCLSVSPLQGGFQPPDILLLLAHCSRSSRPSAESVRPKQASTEAPTERRDGWRAGHGERPTTSAARIAASFRPAVMAPAAPPCAGPRRPARNHRGSCKAAPCGAARENRPG